ncbi:hypothetical protein ONS95_011082 [Cadophora gregata]|uniref:uncharacterized protein n=1 Tax=Cadophora gregata TaxID=51156 RepID=UPI0026DC186A|nr:uncharacterized protein ONS95_011082 [Cadophora gregata]KAK0119644.1 hypothetical protein ONS95_011082 [Cadophora gregata]KAK0120682.1 hypothetical protein ONS96_010882 [Cadophora gregata f. sp. sojae]
MQVRLLIFRTFLLLQLTCLATGSGMDPSTTIISVAIIGLGRRSLRHAIPKISKLSSMFKIVAACDSDAVARQSFSDRLPTVPCFETVQELALWKQSTYSVQCAYIAIPHSEYAGVIEVLIGMKVHILKEKPAALSEEELCSFQGQANVGNVRLMTASQCRYSQRLCRLREWLPFVGEPRFVEGTRAIDCTDLGEGWRAQNAKAGGGALNDIGWHLVDTVIGLFANPDQVPRISHSELITTRCHQRYDTEDTAFVYLKVPKDIYGCSSKGIRKTKRGERCRLNYRPMISCCNPSL